MPIILALLRAVNVGGNHMIRMETLRSLCESIGLRNPKTYLQSGNVVFEARKRDLDGLGTRLEDAIERAAGFRPDVILRTAAEFRQCVEQNPFAGRDDVHPAKLAVVFLASEPSRQDWEKVRSMAFAPEEVKFGRRELYIYYPDGMGKSKLQTKLLEKSLGTCGTARNWNSVTALQAMAAGMVSAIRPSVDVD